MARAMFRSPKLAGFLLLRIVGPQHNRLNEAVGSNVGGEFVDFRVAHYRQHLGGGMHRAADEPREGRGYAR